ncbi:MAG: tRNA 2-thiocytidine biosynthesis TtcA family protein [Chlamydiota bacterium]
MFDPPKPPWTHLGKSIESKVRKALHTFSLLDGVDQIAVALSGGKDSLTLLFILHSILGKGLEKIPLSAIHVSGSVSCGASFEEKRLRQICKQLQVPFYVQHSSLEGTRPKCYTCSRERRRLLFEQAKQIGCSFLAFGHHKDDAISTLLLNVLHKAEFASMLPKIFMEKYGVTILRPLFYLEEEEIRRFAQQQNFQTITCKCPVASTSKRAETKEIVSYLERSFPRARSNLFLAGLQYGSKKALQP